MTSDFEVLTVIPAPSHLAANHQSSCSRSWNDGANRTTLSPKSRGAQTRNCPHPWLHLDILSQKRNKGQQPLRTCLTFGPRGSATKHVYESCYAWTWYSLWTIMDTLIQWQHTNKVLLKVSRISSRSASRTIESLDGTISRTPPTDSKEDGYSELLCGEWAHTQQSKPSLKRPAVT